MIAHTARLAAATAALAFASSAAAQVTYQVNRTIGGGSVVGTIQTDGRTGVLAAADVLSWNLKLTGAGGPTVTLMSAGGTSANVLYGSDLSVTGNKLNFNFSGTDGGIFLFQSGLYSGNKYWCNATAAGACAKGDSVVPESYNSASAQYMDQSGLQVLGVGGPLISDAELRASLLALVQARTLQMITNNLLSSLLVGFNEQVSCGNCGGADATFGSFNLGAHGRYSLTREFTLLGGASIGQFHEQGADVQLSGTFAAALRFDPANMGASRPFVELGASASPNQTTTYSRPYTYQSASSTGEGEGKTHSSTWNVYGRVGYVSRLTPRDEVAVAATAAHTWQVVKGYLEATDPNNPIAAAFAGGTDEMTVVGLGAQYTRLVTRYVEAGVTAGVQHSIDPKSGISAAFSGSGSPALPGAPERIWAVYGARLGVRFSRRLTGDAFIDGVSGPSGMGTSLHGGVGFRFAF